MAQSYRIYRAKITRHHGLGASGLCWELIGWKWGKGNKSFIGQLWGLLQHLSVWSHGKVAGGLFHLKGQGLKPNLGQDVIFHLQEGQILLPLALCWPCASSAASGAADYLGEKPGLWGVWKGETWFLKLGNKTKFNQSLQDLQFH